MFKNINIELIIWIVIWIFFWYLITKIIFISKLKQKRKESVQKSRSVLLWSITEQFAPLLPKFKYNYKDAMFLWKWVDYIVFDWLSEWNLREIIFLEVKTWKSSLNKNERQIKNIVNSKQVFYETMRI